MRCISDSSRTVIAGLPGNHGLPALSTVMTALRASVAVADVSRPTLTTGPTHAELDRADTHTPVAPGVPHRAGRQRAALTHLTAHG